MDNQFLLPEDHVSRKIYVVRNHSIMFDFDLAMLYQVETRVLKQAVKRNRVRFPDDFMFELSKEEWQQVITACDNLPAQMKFSPRPPSAFTEAGVAMLSGVLSSARAILVNIQIIRVFTKLRQIITGHAELRLEIEQIKLALKKQNKDLGLVFKYLDQLASKATRPSNAPRKRIGYKPDTL